MKARCHILSIGAFAPEERVSNSDLAKIVDTDDQWIVERTGIRERRRIASGDNTSDLALRAAWLALDQINMKPQELTHVIAATCTPDYLAPSVACIVAGDLGAGPVMAFDLEAACTGYIYGLSVGRSILAGEPDSRILLICAEAMTRRINWQDRSTCVLFGDGAVACILGNQPEPICAVEDVISKSDGSQHQLIIVGGGTACGYSAGTPVNEDFFITMQGRDTYKLAVRHMVNVCRELLERNRLTIRDIDLFIPHQANLRIIESVGSRLGITEDHVFTNVENYGNTSAASIPLALAEARAQNRIRPGAHVLVTAFGAGMTWGAALLQF